MSDLGHKRTLAMRNSMSAKRQKWPKQKDRLAAVSPKMPSGSFLISHSHTERSDLNVARTSDTKSAGCSHAAKCVPLGWLL